MIYSPRGQKEFYRKTRAQRAKIDSLKYVSDKHKKELHNNLDEFERTYENNRIKYLNSRIRSSRIKEGCEKPDFDLIKNNLEKVAKALSKNYIELLKQTSDIKDIFNKSRIKNNMLN